MITFRQTIVTEVCLEMAMTQIIWLLSEVFVQINNLLNNLQFVIDENNHLYMIIQTYACNANQLHTIGKSV